MADTNSFEETTLIESVRDQGWWVSQQFFPLDLLQQLAEEANFFYSTKQMHPAGIGRGNNFQHNAAIRTDFTHWLNGSSAAQQEYLGIMENLRKSLNRELYLGLFELEAHFAFYPPGAFYKKHLDSFQGNENRIISTVTYLNFDWPDDGGGELTIYAPIDETQNLSIKPKAGTLVVFLSEEIAHEVQICHYPRMSIAGWFRLVSKRQ